MSERNAYLHYAARSNEDDLAINQVRELDRKRCSDATTLHQGGRSQFQITS